MFLPCADLPSFFILYNIKYALKICKIKFKLRFKMTIHRARVKEEKFHCN